MTTYRNFRHLQPVEDYAVFHEDFFTFGTADIAKWTITTTEAGAGSATEAVSNTLPGGVLVVTNDAADDDADFFQLVNETFTFALTKKLSFKVRFKVSDATQCDLVFGLSITDTTPLAVSDGIYIRKDDGDALLDFVVMKNSTASTLTGFGTLATDTWTTLEFYYDGAGSNIDISKDGVRAGSLPLTNAPDDEGLTVTFGIQNGEAVAKILSLDYILVQQQR